jgi:hypothetical protein
MLTPSMVYLIRSIGRPRQDIVSVPADAKPSAEGPALAATVAQVDAAGLKQR